MIRRVLPWIFFLIASAFVRAGAADIKHGPESVWVDPGWRRTVARYAITFDEQGMSTTVSEFEIMVLNPRGVEAISQLVLDYNSYFEELVASDLATVKADGRVIAVDERAVHDQPASADSSSPYFNEQRTMIIAYPDVSLGDRIRGRLYRKDKKAKLQGEYAQIWSQALDQPPEVIELTLDGPASKPVRTFARDVEHTEERVGERIIHRVRFKQDSPASRLSEIGSFDTARRFEASTFANYGALASYLDYRNAPMAVPNETIRNFATEIAGDASTTAGKVARLHNWVARNIRYVGIGFEDGGLVSQPAAEVLVVRYGDCKAHATLLKALLTAQGIEANFIVVNTGSNYTLTELPTLNFDHAIVYVPELDQYLDPTASKVAFGALPASLAGKPALNVDKGNLSRIPVASPERYAITSDTDYAITMDGKRQGRTVLSGVGLGGELVRHFGEVLERADRKKIFERMMEDAHLRGTGDYAFSDPRELSDEYAITTNFQLDALDLSKPLQIRMEALPDARPSILALSTRNKRDQPFLCQSMLQRTTVSLGLPEGVQAAEKPAAATYEARFKGTTIYGEVNGEIDMRGEVVLDGRTIRSQARMQLKFDKPVCPAEFVEEIKKGLAKFDKFQGGFIGLTSKPVPYVTETSPDYDEGIKAYNSKNYELALKRLKPLAENGHVRAQHHVGWMYEAGLGVSVDHHEAVRWYGLAAEQGDLFSQTRLGYFYEKGLGVARDYRVATQMFRKSAEAGDENAQGNLGAMYRDGRGVARDFKEAKKWFAMAADQGSAWALMNIGLLHTHGGDGVPLDYPTAMDFFRKAADKGNADAQYDIGWMYEAGLGVSKDRQLAMEWYSKAAGKGHMLAWHRMDGLNESRSQSTLGSWSALLHILGL